MKNLISKIELKKAKIGIVGLGYVGLPLVSEFLSNGFEVIGIDKDQSKIDALNDRKSYIAHINSKFISHFYKNTSDELLPGTFSSYILWFYIQS